MTPMIHKAELAGYSSVVGQPIMLLNEQGTVIGQLALIGAHGDYNLMVAEIADVINAPNRHAYRVGREVGRGSAAAEIKDAADEAHSCGAERDAWKARVERAEAALDPAWLARMEALVTAADGLAEAVEGWRDTSIGIGQAIANVELKLQAFRAAQEAANG